MAADNGKTSEKMSFVKNIWDKAPAGPKKDQAQKHYEAAEKAYKAQNDVEVHKELDAAKHALT